MNRMLDEWMDPTSEDSSQELEPSGGSSNYAILFVLYLLLIILWFVWPCSALIRRIRRREEDQSEDSGDSTTRTTLQTITGVERRKALIHCFQKKRVTMEVRAENLKSEHMKGSEDADGDSATLSLSDHAASLDEDLEMGTSSVSDSDQNEAGELVDAPPALEIYEEDLGIILELPRKHYPRTVPNACAICLEAYKPDETVVWSSNIDCSHAFHQDCIIDYWLVKLTVGDTVPCPCCRQDFMSLSLEADDKGASGDAEELNAIVAADTTHNMVSENV